MILKAIKKNYLLTLVFIWEVYTSLFKKIFKCFEPVFHLIFIWIGIFFSNIICKKKKTKEKDLCIEKEMNIRIPQFSRTLLSILVDLKKHWFPFPSFSFLSSLGLFQEFQLQLVSFLFYSFLFLKKKLNFCSKFVKWFTTIGIIFEG